MKRRASASPEPHTFTTKQLLLLDRGLSPFIPPIALPWELIEIEIASQAPLRTQMNMAMTCRRLYQIIPLLIRKLPLRLVYPGPDDDYICRFQNLNTLRIPRAMDITDAVLGRLTRLTYVGNCRTITDSGLSKLVSLTILDLNYHPKITDESHKFLTNLISLDFDSSDGITDESITHLTNLIHITAHSLITAYFRSST